MNEMMKILDDYKIIFRLKMAIEQHQMILNF